MGRYSTFTPAPASLLPTIHDALGDLADLPRTCESWRLAERHSGGGSPACAYAVRESLKAAARHGAWDFPDRPVVFLSDPHADAEGFLRSLVAAGVIRRLAQGPDDFELTAFGRAARIVIGGDCLDKGPSNLDMLDSLAALMNTGAEVHLLAGNHDLRMRVAIQGLTGTRSPLTEHLFIRMGRKIIPLLREVYERYVAPHGIGTHVPDEAFCRARVFPAPGWAERFPQLASSHLSDHAIARELDRMARKQVSFEVDVARAGLSMRALYAAALHCPELFFEDSGPYGWFFASMEVIARIGSLLFVHAGLDDAMCDLLARGGVTAVNGRYRQDAERDPFAFYCGPVANLVRTKYRTSDRLLTSQGVAQLHRTGVKMVVQGHVNNHAGQRLLAKQGLLHLEGDVTLDRASRGFEGLSGIGAGATLFFPSGDVLGLSSDYPNAKHFHPAHHAQEAD